MKRPIVAAGPRRRIALGLAVAAMTGALGACGSAQASGTTDSVASAGVQVAHTALGTVGYRVIGSGPPLILIMGYAGTMETWEPQFVDTLAKRNRVVIFDNAGIGSTQALASPLTIDAMADQTSALIDALGLGRPDVLGWSMGGMIAQALAVLHPDQVRRLVLCATFPGVGTVVPPQAAINALTNGNGLAELFPANQAMAADSFVAGTSGYPAAAPASAATTSAQRHAALAWFGGTDSAGQLTARIAVPTLVADGTDDRLDAVSNSRTIAGRIPGAKLLLYPDAGHGFLFQEGTPFAVTVESFLAGAPGPRSTAAIGSEFLAGEARIASAGKTWVSRLKALTAKPIANQIGYVPASPTADQIADIDQPFASAITDLDYQLLSAGITGTAGDAITTFVTADEKLASDIRALSALSTSFGTWQATTTRDTDVEQRAAAVLRKDLELPPAR